MLTFGLWALLPLIFSASTAAGLWLVYFIAVTDEWIAPLGSPYRTNGSLYIPYISVAGNFPPASCVFSQVLNMAAFMGFVVVVLRYVQLRSRIPAWLNVASLLGFSLACFGLTLVGNFQLFAQPTAHNVGTMMVFVLGTLSCWVQSYVTLRADINHEGRAVGAVRLLLSGLVSLCMTLYKVFQFQQLHIQAAQCQWALAMSFFAFLGTFAVEFRLCRFRVVCVEIRGGGPEDVSVPLSEA